MEAPLKKPTWLLLGPGWAAQFGLAAGHRFGSWKQRVREETKPNAAQDVCVPRLESLDSG